MDAVALQSELDRLARRLPGRQPYENRRPLNVPARYAGGSVREFLALQHEHVMPSYWEEAVAAGRLLRRGVPVSLEASTHAGDQLTHVIPETVEPDVDGGIRVLHLDEAVLLVVYKPAPLPVHPCGRFNRNTLIWLLGEAGRNMQMRPRPAHRLDANTAGVMVLTLTREAAREVQGQFAAGGVNKLYLVEVEGRTPLGSFRCCAPLAKEPTMIGGRRPSEAGVVAESRFRTLAHDEGRSLLAAVPITGRTNQLRAHLWHLGTPVVGDRYYLPKGQLGEQQTLAVAAEAMRLQAIQLGFRHPVSGERVRFRAAPKWAPSGWRGADEAGRKI